MEQSINFDGPVLRLVIAPELDFDFLHDSLHPEPDLKPFEVSSHSAAVATVTIMKMRACLIRLSWSASTACKVKSGLSQITCSTSVQVGTDSMESFRSSLKSSSILPVPLIADVA